MLQDSGPWKASESSVHDRQSDIPYHFQGSTFKLGRPKRSLVMPQPSEGAPMKRRKAKDDGDDIEVLTIPVRPLLSTGVLFDEKVILRLTIYFRASA